MIETTFDYNQLGTAGMFIGYLIYDRTVLLKKLVDKFDHHEKLFYRLMIRIDKAEQK